jgi:AcrR family transcriptional regulator
VARKIPETRFDQLVDAATEVFIERGYRMTQMSDIASAIGVAKGTLYTYVESKEALFALCVFHADRSGVMETPETLPVPAPRSGELSSTVKQALADQSLPAALGAALDRERVDDARRELEGVVRELYQLFERFHRAIKLIDRCADHPELHQIWQTHGREAPRAALGRYLETRMRDGQLRPVANVALAARMIIEVCSTWAVHIRWDRSPENFDRDEARENAIDFLVSALALP